MNRNLGTALAAAVLLPLSLTACGTESPAGRGDASVDPAESRARAEAHGTARELVYLTEVPGYEVAAQSVGVHGGDGFGATYTRRGRGNIELAVDRGTLRAADCSDGFACEEEGDLRYRASAELQEYAEQRDGHTVKVSAAAGEVGRDTLRKAAEAARPAGDAEVMALLPGPPESDVSPTRGDLPPEGDGAPYSGAGAGG